MNLPQVQPPPEPLNSLYNDNTPEANDFYANYRKYNSALQMEFSAVNVDRSITGGVQQFTVNGAVHHLIGPLHPNNPNPGETAPQHKFAQIYILDPDEEIAARMAVIPKLKQDLLQQLQDAAHAVNPYVQAYEKAKTALQPQFLLVFTHDAPDKRHAHQLMRWRRSYRMATLIFTTEIS